jgi:S-adenosylmethionine synthetase
MIVTLRPAEFVLPGHPDKLCDAIADALVAEASRRQPRSLCGVEVAAHRSAVFITGRIACRGAETIDVTGLVRQVYRSAGYGADWAADPDCLRIETDLCLGPLDEDEERFRAASDDQAIVTGYAVDLPGTNYLPPEHWLAARLARALERLRSAAPDLGLGPDGKVFILLEDDGEAAGHALRLASVSASLQHAPGRSVVDLH